MRLNNESVETRVVGQRQTYGGWLAAIGARLVEELSDSAEVRRTLRESASDSVIGLGGSETLEQETEAPSEAADVTAALGDECEQLLALRSDVM